MKITKSEFKEMIREALREELATRTSTRIITAESASPTYMSTYDKLRKKFQLAEQKADETWAKMVIDFGEDSGYYNADVATRIKAAAVRNISAGMHDVELSTLCATGNKKIDDLFSSYLEEEYENFYDTFETIWYEKFICYYDGHIEAFDGLEDTFTGNIDDIECLIGIDYASGAEIVWIRGEDDLGFLENHLGLDL